MTDQAKKNKSGNGKAFSTEQLKAISLLARGATRSEAAKGAGISERTLYRWLADPEFSGAVKEAQRAVLDALCSGLANAALISVRYLARVAAGEEQGEKLRIRASAALLSNALNVWRYYELTELEDRVKQIEASMGVSQNGSLRATH